MHASLFNFFISKHRSLASQSVLTSPCEELRFPLSFISYRESLKDAKDEALRTGRFRWQWVFGGERIPAPHANAEGLITGIPCTPVLIWIRRHLCSVCASLEKRCFSLIDLDNVSFSSGSQFSHVFSDLWTLQSGNFRGEQSGNVHPGFLQASLG